MPRVDICETRDDIRLTAEVPGFDPQDLDVQVENGILTITGERKHEVQEGQENTSYYLRERRFGRFERSVTLPASVAADQVQAQYHNGVLTVILPKTETAKPRRVEIQAGDGKAQIGSGRRAA